MITWTDEENEIFRKVNLGYRQIDICNFLDFKIFHLTTFLQKNPHDSNAQKKLKELIRFQQDIQTINNYEEMKAYEKNERCLLESCTFRKHNQRLYQRI